MSVIDKSPNPLSVPLVDLSPGQILTPDSTKICYPLLTHVGFVPESLGHPDRPGILQYVS